MLFGFNILTMSLSHTTESMSLSYNSESDMNLFIINMISQVNESMLFNYTQGLVEIGQRYTGSDNCKKAAQYIYEEFQKMGLWVQYNDWNFKGFNSTNIVATINGTDASSNAIFVICAHYDTICHKNGTVYDNVGATDNAIGVATVLISAKIMSQYAFNHTIRFIAFSGEEIGLLGSYSYAKIAYEQGDNIVAVINVDEIGYATSENESLIIAQTAWMGDWLSILSNNICSQYRDLIDLSIIPDGYFPGSDHAPLYNFGYDFVFFRTVDWDTSWGHSRYDTLDKVNKQYHVKTTKLALAILADLASRTIEIQVIIKNPLEGYVYFFENPLFFVESWDKLYGIDPGALTNYVVPTILLGSLTVRADVMSKDEIESVAFCIDESFMSFDNNPPYEWKIQGWHYSFLKYPLIGKHLLTVIATTKSGKLARDQMDITTFVL
jgi:hypothetical protein